MRIEYARSTSLIGIPYGPVDRPNGDRCHGFFDLKANPALIDAVPELGDIPELKAFVRELNHPRSIVRSLACEKSISPFDDPVVKFKLTSFVRICFEILSWNYDEKNYELLFTMLNEGAARAKKEIADFVIVELKLDPAVFAVHGTTGWSMTLWVNGWGPTEKDAKAYWMIGIQMLQDFFASQRTMFGAELDKGLPTVLRQDAAA